MPIYLTHPEHGTHICYNSYEVEQCEKNGWKQIEQKPVEVNPVEEKPKRGRPKKVKDGDNDIRRTEDGGS